MTHSDVKARFPQIVMLLSLLAFGGLVWLFFTFTIDDAYITFRYATHLASDGVLTFNLGEPPVEGVTTFLWTVILAAGVVVGVPPVILSKILGIIANLGTVLVMFLWSRELLGWGGRRQEMYLASATAVWSYLLCPWTALHAVSGMETALFTALVTLFAYQIRVVCHEPSHNRLAMLAGVALLMGLTRPEGNLVAAASLSLWVAAVEPPIRKKALGYLMALYVLPGAIYFCIRYTVYGLCFPLPFYVKLGEDGWFNGWRYVGGHVLWTIIHWGPLPFLGLPELKLKRLAPLAGPGALLFFYLIPEPIMGYARRFLFPMVPTVCVLAGCGAVVLVRWLRKRFRRPVTGTRGIWVVLWGLIALGWGLVLPKQVDLFVERLARGLEASHVSLGKALRHCGNVSGATDGLLLAIGDAGAVPYFSGWRTLDTFGLNNPRIALSGHRDPDYILAHKPDVLVLLSRNEREFTPILPWEGALHQVAVDRGYEYLGYKPFTEGYYLWVLVPSGSHLRPCLQQAVEPPRENPD